MSTKRKTCPEDIYQSAVAKKVAALAAEPNLVVHVGDVGYTFRKEFNAGWFRGVVVEIREGAGEFGVVAMMLYHIRAIIKCALNSLPTLTLPSLLFLHGDFLQSSCYDDHRERVG
jgi:hypothetical protein